MTTFYLSHHGIKGQKWGEQNGPPYPLNTATHNRVVNSEKSKNYGSNKLVANDDFASHTSVSRYVTDRASGVNPNHYNDNCKEVAMTICDNIAFDKHEIAPGRMFDGTLLDMMKNITGYDEDVLKNGVYTECTIAPDNGARRCSKAILKEWGEGAVGCIGVKAAITDEQREIMAKRLGISSDIDGHVFNWIIEDGNVKFFDGQDNTVVDATDFFKGVEKNSMAEIVCYDNSGPRDKDKVKAKMDLGADLLEQQRNQELTNHMFAQAEQSRMEMDNARMASDQAMRDAVNASNMAASLGLSGGANPFIFGMM